MKSIIDKILYTIYNFKDIELKLRQYHGYRRNTIIEWKNKSGLSWNLTRKVLSTLTIYNSQEIREMLRDIVKNNSALFNSTNLFITGFGNAGKSGDVILYEFNHAVTKYEKSLIKSWQVNDLPSGSTILFFDDVIGTGSQSVEFINEKLNLMLKASYNCYLVSLCATKSGLAKINNETNFQVISCITLDESKHELLSANCHVFSKKEKEILNNLNTNLKKSGKNDFDKGLLIAFFHSIPNNTMPIIWKDGFPFKDSNNNSMKWFGILPRNF
jgi:hypothetical protein